MTTRTRTISFRALLTLREQPDQTTRELAQTLYPGENTKRASALLTYLRKQKLIQREGKPGAATWRLADAGLKAISDAATDPDDATDATTPPPPCTEPTAHWPFRPLDTPVPDDSWANMRVGDPIHVTATESGLVVELAKPTQEEPPEHAPDQEHSAEQPSSEAGKAVVVPPSCSNARPLRFGMLNTGQLILIAQDPMVLELTRSGALLTLSRADVDELRQMLGTSHD